MEKVFELRQWYIKEHEEGVMTAQGNCYYNPRFMDGHFIHTSRIMRSVRYRDGWMAITRSGSHYALLDSEVVSDEARAAASKRVLEALKDSDCADELFRILEEKKKQIQEDSLGMENGTAVFCFRSDAEYYIDSAVIKNGGIAVNAKANIHVGMFQDSVLLCGDYGSPVSFDFRFFPFEGNRVEFYSWDDDYKVTIRNIGKEPLEIDTPFGYFLIPDGDEIIPDKEKRFRITEHTSPAVDKHNLWDVREVNGMIGYSTPKTDDEDDESGDG